jgi:hypothetical protein
MPNLLRSMRGGTEKPSAPPRRRAAKIALAAAFAVGASLVCVWSWKHNSEKYEAKKPPVPVLDFIPTVPKENQQAVTQAVTAAFGLALFLSPEQRAQVQDVWKVPPRTLDELIQRQKQTDKVLTPEQRQKLKPVRRMVEGKVVDLMFEPGRKRFTPEEFEQLKNEIKRRTAQRMETE